MKSHPATLTAAELYKQCRLKRVRRSGPGGQHRNKVETAVVVTHLESGIQAEANERRSAEQNRLLALFRLRLNLALSVRMKMNKELSPSLLWNSRCNNRRIYVNARHEDFPSLLAEVLDALEEMEWSIQNTSQHFQCSATQLVKFLKQEPRSLMLLNEKRGEMGLSTLK